MFSMEWPNHIQSCRPGVSSENRSHGFYDGRQHILRPFFTMEKNDGVYIKDKKETKCNGYYVRVNREYPATSKNWQLIPVKVLASLQHVL
jgi:hypothetical protein